MFFLIALRSKFKYFNFNSTYYFIKDAKYTYAKNQVIFYNYLLKWQDLFHCRIL